MAVKTSLLREKFIIKTDEPVFNAEVQDVPATSNRMPIRLQAGGLEPEEYVVRAHNMHSCARMAAQMLQDYDKGGPLLNRVTPYKWEEVWSEVVNDFELAYNPERWICVYYKGKPLFEAGKRHPFLDVVEQCDAVNKTEDYDASLKLAEDAFMRAGKSISIGYDSSVAIIANLQRDEGRCGMILRGPERTTTFNFVVEVKKADIPINAPQCLRTAASLLEGIQLSFMIGVTHEKLRREFITSSSQEARKAREGRRRLLQLNTSISALETNNTVRYRPERPDFNRIILETEKIAYKFVRDPNEKDDVYID